MKYGKRKKISPCNPVLESNSKSNIKVHLPVGRLHVKSILRKLREAGLQIDITKCSFHVIEVSYLGLIVTTKSIKMDSAKIETVIN